MNRKKLLISIVTVIALFCLSGCKKPAESSEPNQTTAKTQAEYNTEAKERINKDNMDAELERIEKELEEEMSQQQ